MKQPAHTITASPWRGLGFGERVALDAMTAMLWPLQPDGRLTVLLNLLASQIQDMAENEDQAEAIVEMLRMHLRLQYSDETPSPPLQNY